MRHVLVLTVISFVFLILGNNLLSLTNPDEVFYSLSAQEMVQHHTWLVPHIFGQPQFEKPVFLFWLLRASFVMFGPTSFAARFPPALFGWLGCLTLYYFCLSAYRDRNKAFLCAYVLVSSGLFFAMSRFVFTDMIFSVFVLMSLTAFYTGYIRPERKRSGLVLFGVFSALAVLTKGLLGIVFPVGTVLVFLALRRDLRFLFTNSSLYGVILFLVLALPWYVFMIHRFGDGFIHEFFYNDHIRRILEAEHPSNDTWFFYPMTLVVGMLPWSVVLVAAFGAIFKQRQYRTSPPQVFLISWVATMFVVLQCAHSKLTSYILPAMPALAVIAGDYVCNLVSHKKWKPFYVLIGLSSVLVIGLSLAVFVIATGIFHIGQNNEYIPTRPIAVLLLTLSVTIVGACFFLARANRHRLGVCMLGLQLPVLFLICFLSRDQFEDYVSSQQISAYLLKQDGVNNTVLCSKKLVRGVRYYTNKDVAVIDGNFFSPHPIPLVNTDQQIREFLTRQQTTYAVVGRDQFERLKRVSEQKFEFTDLVHLGDAHLVRVNAAPASP